MTIKKLNNVLFANEKRDRAAKVSGYALYEEGCGYYAFSHMRDKHGILIPYIPCGGRRALQAIIDAGGFVSMDGMEYVNPIA